MALGRQVVDEQKPRNPAAAAARVNTRNALWQARWPAIALPQCVEMVESAPKDQQAEVKRRLPCAEGGPPGPGGGAPATENCPQATRCLNAKRKELGGLLYDREIQTKPRSQESTLFPFELFAPMLRTDLAMVPHFRKTFGVESTQLVVSGWDLAWSEKVGGDRLVRCTALLDLRRNKRRVLNMQRYREGLSYSQQCALIAQESRRFGDDLVVIETDAAQIIWAQNLEEKTDLPIFRHTAGDKKDFHIGVPGLLIDLDNERWEFPYNEDGPGFAEMQAFLAECEAFGWQDGKLEGVGEHDDMVMAWWHCSHGLKVLSGNIEEIRRGDAGRVDRGS